VLVTLLIPVIVWNGMRVRRPVWVYSPNITNHEEFIAVIQNAELSMDDPELLAKIRGSLVHPQNVSERQLLATPPHGHMSQHRQDFWIDNFFKNRTNGFFVECGAYDGEHLSNTVFFEVKRNWTGLLIEAGPNLYKSLLKRKRHAYSIHACLSPVSYPKTFDFVEMVDVSTLSDFEEASHLLKMKRTFGARKGRPLICYPFYSIMLAIEQTRIDFFSLDVEGAELPILRTIPFNKIYIDLIMIEFGVWGSRPDSNRKLEEIRLFFNNTKQFKEVGILNNYDVLFQHL